MKRAHRFPQRLVRWTSLCVCLALVLTSLAMVPLAGGNNSIALAQGRSDSPNGKGRKVSPAPPVPGAPAASLPNLDEVRQRPNIVPAAPAPNPSLIRSRRKPLESRNGRKVGDRLPRQRVSGYRVGEERMGIVRAAANRKRERSHHASASLSFPQAGPTNVALAANGGITSASSTYSTQYPTTEMNDGDRKGLQIGNVGCWTDATPGAFPDWVQVDFSGSKSINEIDLFSLQDNYMNPVEPTETLTFTIYGNQDFDVQYWDGTAWATVSGGSIVSNNKVWRKITFATVTTSKIRIVINRAASSYSYVTEVEAYGNDAGASGPTADQFVQNFLQWGLARSANGTEASYWTDIMRAAYPRGQTSMLIATREFGMTVFESAEYAARGRNNNQYVYDLYKTYLMREPDGPGWAFWEGQCNAYGREQVRRAFDECGEFATVVAAINPGGSASSNVSSLLSARVDPNNQPGNQLLARDAEWGATLLSLPGRAGLDLGLGLSYSSAAVWTRSGPYSYFDEDIGTPSPGFHLGFPIVQEVFFDAQVGVNVRPMITPSGQRVEFRQVGTSNIYEAADSSYLQLIDYVDNFSVEHLLVRSTDGTQMSYVKLQADWHCTQIEDRNGNLISVNYDWRGDIANLTDTLGRVITFNYDGNANLISMTQTWSGQTHTWATFGWGNLSMQPDLPGVVGTHSGDVIPVLTQVGLDDGSLYAFEYNPNGQVNLIRRYTSDNVQRSYTAYDYTASADSSPRLTGQRVWAENWTGINGVPNEVVTQFADPGDGSHVMTAPDGTVFKEFYGGTGSSPAWQRGLPVRSEVWSGGSQQKISTIAWTQDDPNINYQTTPRVIETNIYDSAGNHSRTTVGYYTCTLPTSGANCSLPADLYEYEANATTVARHTHTDYNLDANYLNRRIIGLPQAKYLYEGPSTLMAKTTYVYDWGGEYLQGLPAAPTQHDGSYSSDFVVGRGNLVDMLRWDVNDPNNATKALESKIAYDINGSVLFTRDALNHQTTISYSDAFSDGNNRNTFAYPTTVTDADSYSSSVQYQYDFGARTRVQGPPPAGQSQGVIQTFTYDSAARLQQATTANTGAYQRYEYGPNYVQQFSSVNSVADDSYAIQFFDGAGRTFLTSSNHPGSVGLYRAQWTQYDLMGRVMKQSNPTEVNSDRAPAGEDAAGWIFTQQTYDWKGRPLFTTNTDGSQKYASYSACGCAGSEVTTLTDEVGRQEKVYSDVLGRTAKTEALNWNGTVYATTLNAYNGRDQVTQVRQYQGNDQSGVYQDTSMSYDGYGRLQSKHLPEQDSGTATVYSYNADDTVQSITDARGATCTYGYNARHQVTGATHVLSGQTIALSYGYDAAGNRTSMTDGAGSMSYHYDQLSRMDWEERTFTGLGTYRLSYGYNLAGQLTSLTEPSQFGGVVSYAHDPAGRLTDMTGSGFGTTTQFATGIQYRASGVAKHVSYGSGAQLNVTYNGRLLPTRYELGNVIPSGTTPTIMGTENQFYDDGRIRYAQDLQNGNFDRAYDYDHVGRIKEAYSGREARGLPPLFPRDNPFRQSYSYDVWSNMARPSNQHWSANLPDNPTYTNNRRGGWGYDANGQVTSRDSETKLHTYDASGQETHYWEYIFHPEEPWFAETNTIDQTYDGDGRRVKRFESRQRENAGGTETESDTTYYLSSSALGGAMVIEMVPGGYGTKEHFYVGSQKIAERNTDSGYIGWRHVNPVTGSWLTSDSPSSGGFTHRNELDPLGTDVGLSDPYVTVTATYSDMMGLVSLYEERGNPFDPGGGCGTLDGLPISCSELQQRLHAGTVEVEYSGRLVLDPQQPAALPDRTWVPQRGPISDYGVGLYSLWMPSLFRTERSKGGQVFFVDPQNPVIRAVPLGDLRRGLEDLLKKKDCGDYVQKLLNEANRLFGGSYPHINTFWEGYNKISSAGGYQLDGVASNGGTVTGDLFANGALPGTVHMTPYRTIDRVPTAQEAAWAQSRYAYTALHETFHLAGQGGYSDEQMARAAFSLAGLEPPKYGRNDILKWSGRFDEFLGQHCPNDTTPKQKP
jgi:YD repeat-containing protein